MATSPSPASNVYREARFETAQEFLRALDWTDDRWHAGDSAWVFRGHGDAKWTLTASAYRIEGPEHKRPFFTSLRDVAYTISSSYRESFDSSDAHVRRRSLISLILAAERFGARRFAQLADEIGFNIPGNKDEFIGVRGDAVLGRVLDEVQHWGGQGVLAPPGELEAIAQHYGIPTRLLDWTSSPRVAAYFALRDAIRKKTSTCAVWALNDRAAPFLSFNRVQVIRFPNQNNTYMRSQRGLFTWDCLAEQIYLESAAWPCQAEAIRSLTFLDSLPAPVVLLQKLELPTSEAAKGLAILRKDGITLAHMMPSLQNVGETVKDLSAFFN